MIWKRKNKLRKKKVPPGERWSNNARRKNIEEGDIIERSTKKKENKRYDVGDLVNMRICM
jgi:hypothetical protein